MTYKVSLRIFLLLLLKYFVVDCKTCGGKLGASCLAFSWSYSWVKGSRKHNNNTQQIPKTNKVMDIKYSSELTLSSNFIFLFSYSSRATDQKSDSFKPLFVTQEHELRKALKRTTSDQFPAGWTKCCSCDRTCLTVELKVMLVAVKLQILRFLDVMKSLIFYAVAKL